MMEISMLLAFGAGVASFLSPCVLPMVPIYISYLLGDVSANNAGKNISITGSRAVQRGIISSLLFVLGFTSVFVALGVTASAIGGWLRYYTVELRYISGVIIILFGIHMTGLLPIKALYKEFRLGSSSKQKGLAGYLLLGMAFAAGWSPCAGPILGAVLFYAAGQETAVYGAALLTAYSLGLGIPFILMAFGLGKAEPLMDKLRTYLPVISKGSGVLLILFGILLMSGKLSLLSEYLNFLPNY